MTACSDHSLRPPNADEKSAGNRVLLPAGGVSTLPRPKRPCRNGSRAGPGIALVEVILSLAILGMTLGALSRAFTLSRNSLESQVVRGLVDSAMRSRMERLLAEDWTDISDGSQTVTLAGKNYTITWTFSPIDLNGDTVAEAEAKLVTVTSDGRTVTSIMCKHTGKYLPEKIS